MENQHKKISGYRSLSEAEIGLMNRAKALEGAVGALYQELAQAPGIDKRSLALARTNLQQGFMWMVRSIAQPRDVFEEKANG